MAVAAVSFGTHLTLMWPAHRVPSLYTCAPCLPTLVPHASLLSSARVTQVFTSLEKAAGGVDEHLCIEFALYSSEHFGTDGLGFFACLDFEPRYTNATSFGTPMGAYSSYSQFTNVDVQVCGF